MYFLLENERTVTAVPGQAAVTSPGPAERLTAGGTLKEEVSSRTLPALVRGRPLRVAVAAGLREAVCPQSQL